MALPHVEMLRGRMRRLASRSTVAGTLPVLFFGDLPCASIATIGLNPSHREYADARGQLLSGSKQRFATLPSLGADSRASLSDAQCDVALELMRRYHEPTRPVYGWFRGLNRVVAGLGGSFVDGSAVHLDLVQEATNPTWSNLPVHEREELLAADLEFLEWQLRTFGVRTVICTSKMVGTTLRPRFDVEVLAEGILERIRWWVGRGEANGHSLWFAGWNIPLARPTGLGGDGETALGRLLKDQLSSKSRGRTSSTRAKQS